MAPDFLGAFLLVEAAPTSGQVLIERLERYRQLSRLINGTFGLRAWLDKRGAGESKKREH